MHSLLVIALALTAACSSAPEAAESGGAAAAALTPSPSAASSPVDADPSSSPSPAPSPQAPTPDSEPTAAGDSPAGAGSTVTARSLATDPLQVVRGDAVPLDDETPIVRGVYSTMHSFWGSRYRDLLKLIRTTELNALVIDVKDDKGQLAWEMDLPLAVKGGGGAWKPHEEPRKRLDRLADAGGYAIARIVCFKDSYVAEARPGLAVIDTRDGEPWEGRDGQLWLNPYDDRAWQWCVDVGIEAAKQGFDEIQFDYMRFPNGGDGPSEHFSFPGVPEDRPEKRWRHPDEITEFLASARRQIHRHGARVSGDVFGLITYNHGWNGDGTGQVWEALADELDYLSPMVYPSHYGAGNYGFDEPVDHPYGIVEGAMTEARERSIDRRATVRPWLEDFAPTWLGRGHSPQRVRDQIRAVYERGIESWLLWNAGNSYSVEALREELEPRADDWEPRPPRDRDDRDGKAERAERSARDGREDRDDA